MRPTLRFALVCFGILSSACSASNGSRLPEDAARQDSTADAPDASSTNDARTDAASCPSGQHICGSLCVDDLANTPDRGCRLGCGDACARPTGTQTFCTNEGTCATRCEPPFREENGACVCSPATECSSLGFECGAQPNGCGGTIECGGCSSALQCISGRCGCANDAREPNDSNGLVEPIGSLNDTDLNSQALPNLKIAGSTDIDWYRFNLADAGFGGNPSIVVTATSTNTTIPLEVAIFHDCSYDNENLRETESFCCEGTLNTNTLGRGCVSPTSRRARLITECPGTDEGGLLYIRVQTTATDAGLCIPYSINIAINEDDSCPG